MNDRYIPIQTLITTLLRELRNVMLTAHKGAWATCDGISQFLSFDLSTGGLQAMVSELIYHGPQTEFGRGMRQREQTASSASLAISISYPTSASGIIS